MGEMMSYFNVPHCKHTSGKWPGSKLVMVLHSSHVQQDEWEQERCMEKGVNNPLLAHIILAF